MVSLSPLPRLPSLRLDGKRALVTGAGRGIGLAAAAGLAQSGAHVVLAARTLAEVEAAAEQIRAEGGSAEAMRMDVTDTAATNAAIASHPPTTNQSQANMRKQHAASFARWYFVQSIQAQFVMVQVEEIILARRINLYHSPNLDSIRLQENKSKFY